MNRPSCPNKLPEDIAETVRRALAEDLGGGDITAALISEHKHAQGYIVSKDTGHICGIPWALEVFRQLNNDVCLDWRVHCLLYTSPSPRDLSTSRMPSSA